jgi:hypothetical protein
MAVLTQPIRDVVWEGVSPWLMAYLVTEVGGVEVPVLQAYLSSISLKVFDRSTQIMPTLTPTVASVIADTIPADGIFAGMNFTCKLDGSIYLPAAKLYTVKAYGTLVGGDLLRFDYELDTVD